MPTRSLLVVAALTAGAAATSADPAPPRVPPRDAPPACIDPVGANGLSAVLARGPKVVGTYKLTPGKRLETKQLRLLATTRFMPERGGSSRGEWLPGLSVSLLPDVVRDGPKAENTIDQHGYEPLRIGTYRVSVGKITPTKKGSKKGSIIETVVEDLGCTEESVHAPLAPGEGKTFWVSTEATRTYAFSTGHWYEWRHPRMYFLVAAGLDPDVQQVPGTTTPRGWISAQAWENQGGLPSWDNRTLATLTAGAVLELPAHEVEVLRVVLGPDTSVVDGRVVTKGKQPVVSALVRVTRKLKPSEGLIRKH